MFCSNRQILKEDATTNLQLSVSLPLCVSTGLLVYFIWHCKTGFYYFHGRMCVSVSLCLSVCPCERVHASFRASVLITAYIIEESISDFV